MIRTAARLGLIALLVGAAGAGAQRMFVLEGRGPGMMAPLANPSAVVAAELAFARLARDKGQWTAFRATADKDAVMFVPQATNAHTFLKKRADPPKSVAWQPGRIFIACDGSYAISTGPWQRPDGSTGTFITLWRLLDNGDYKWALDFGSNKPFRSAGEDEGVDAKVADCAARGPRDGERRGEDRRRNDRYKPPKLVIVRIVDPPPANGEGHSQDGTLRWSWTSGPRARGLKATMRYQGADMTVIDEQVEEAP